MSVRSHAFSPLRYILTALWAMLIFGLCPVSASEVSTKVDAVLVLDQSGSMVETDPEYLCREAARVFVLKLSENCSARVSVVPFSEEPGQTLPLMSLTDERSLQDVLSFLDAFSYTSGDTDIGKAMEAAASILIEGGRQDSAKLIVLLTDGVIDLPAAANEEEAEEKSLTTALLCAERAREMGCAIDTIALDTTGNLDVNLLGYMSERTGGVFASASEVSSLPELFTALLPEGKLESAEPVFEPLEETVELKRTEDSFQNQSMTSDEETEMESFTPKSATEGGETEEEALRDLWPERIVIPDGMLAGTEENRDLSFPAEEEPKAGQTEEAKLEPKTGQTEEAKLEPKAGQTEEAKLESIAGQTEGQTLEDLSGLSSWAEWESGSESESETEREAVVSLAGNQTDPVLLTGFFPSLCRGSMDLRALFRTSGQIPVYLAKAGDMAVLDVSVEGSSLKISGKRKGSTKVFLSASVGGEKCETSFSVMIRPTLASPWILCLFLGGVCLCSGLCLLPVHHQGHMRGTLRLTASLKGRKHPALLTRRVDLERVEEPVSLGDLLGDSYRFSELRKVTLRGRKAGVLLESKSQACRLAAEDGRKAGAEKSLFLEKDSSFQVLCRAGQGRTIEVRGEYYLPEERFSGSPWGDEEDFWLEEISI